MTKCKYWDAGWCYAPDDIETSASSQSACFDYDFCPYLKSQMTKLEEKIQRAVDKVMGNLKTELEPQQIIKDGDCIYFRGEKYQKVEQLEKNQSNLAIAVSNLLVRIEKLEQRLNKQEEREMIKENLKTSLQEMANGVVRPIDDVINEAKEELDDNSFIVDTTLDDVFPSDKPKNKEDENFKNTLDLIKKWGEENKPKTLYQICMEWWDDVFVNEMDNDICIDVLVSKIDKEFIPPHSNTNDYQWNKCLKIMRDKLR